MARHIQEIEIYIPDKELGSLVAAADIHQSLREKPDTPWDFPKERLPEFRPRVLRREGRSRPAQRNVFLAAIC